MFESIAITGISLISALGDDPAALLAAWHDGTSGLSPTGVDELPGQAPVLCGRINLDFTQRLGGTGWRHYTRSSLMATLACRNLMTSLADASVWEQRAEIGICLGYNADASIHLFFSSFFSTLKTKSYRWINPTSFLNISNNAPASLLSLQHQCRGPIFTVTTGFASGLDALNLSATVLQGGHAPAMLVGACQEINPELLESFANLPGENNGGILGSLPRGGVIAGEGCAMLSLEKLSPSDHGRARAWVLGYGEALNLPDQNTDASAAVALAVQNALADAQIRLEDIHAVFLSANGNNLQDTAEATALRGLFGRRCPPAAALKGAWGECYHAGSAMSAAAAVLCLEKGFLPPTLNLAPGYDAEALGLSTRPQTVPAGNILLLSLDRDKKAVALILNLPRKDRAVC